VEQSSCRSKFSDRTCNPIKDPCWRIHEEPQPVGRTHVGEVHEGLSPVGETHAGAGEKHEEEGAAETTHNELTVIPIPHSPVPLGVRR